MKFKLQSNYQPRGDQPAAIDQLYRGLESGEKHQVLLGVTGSGKTFTMAKLIEASNRPALVLAHNKTLAAQLYHEFKSFFPENAVEYFVSYYDFYQPEAYVPSADMYIDKEATINDELDKLRMSATRSLFERRDVIIVASVSCIYGIGSPESYFGMAVTLEKGTQTSREALLRRFVDGQYERSEDLRRGTFRVRGDIIEIYPPYQDEGYRFEMWGEQIDTIRQIDPLTGEVRTGQENLARVSIYPKTHYVMPQEQRERAIVTIQEELSWWKKELEKQGKFVESQRVVQRTMFDIEMMRTIGYCHGVENYSRHLSGRLPGEAPPTLLDYIPEDFVLYVDESHQSIGQVRGMSNGDRARKQTLVDYGFRMPSALDNRPLTFEEFEHRLNQIVYVSATPGPYELTKSGGMVVEQVIRPTGLVDPQVEVRPVKGQVDDLLEEIRVRTSRRERVLVTTLTKRMAEDLSEYFSEIGVKCRYLHSEVETLDRIKILRDLRRGEYDVLIGINLLREGLDLPEVSLVAILDADKEGYLRSATSLIQTIGRCARHVEGRAILYADRMTDSMNQAIGETNRRRDKQLAFNKENNITPMSIIKSVDMDLARIVEADYVTVPLDDASLDAAAANVRNEAQLAEMLQQLETQMREAAKKFEFEKAAQLRDRIRSLKQKDVSGLFSIESAPAPASDKI
ncbi:MAG TPA: excinuclease ABC subunit UvrB [Candidatus Saccharimonadales bacterium]|nr:excinuclease ABC subunit UvrB [Candidatus Saccharimonadales bacterium]